MPEVSGIVRMNIAGMSDEDLMAYRRFLASMSPERSVTFSALYHAVQDEIDERAEARRA